MQGLTDETVHRLVNQSVGAITLDCGYHMAHQASLDILTDVCCDYLKKIATLLRLAKDTEEWRDPDSDFVDSLERVFHQVNIPSAANLHQFICKMDTVKRHQAAQSQHNQQQQQQQQSDSQPELAAPVSCDGGDVDDDHGGSSQPAPSVVQQTE